MVINEYFEKKPDPGGILLAKAGAPTAFSDMAATRNSILDEPFYQAADDFFPANRKIGLTFDDITLATLYSEILPRDTQLDTQLADLLHLHIPIISADMDTVTESRMAIAMALNGGLGLIHYNMPEREQLSQVSRVKNHVHGLIQEPIKVAPDQLIGDVLALIEQKKFGFSTFPVVDGKGRLVGLLSGHVVKPRYAGKKVSEALTPRTQVHTISTDAAYETQVKVTVPSGGSGGLVLFYNEKAFAGITSDGKEFTLYRDAAKVTKGDEQFRWPLLPQGRESAEPMHFSRPAPMGRRGQVFWPTWTSPACGTTGFRVFLGFALG